ncbi:hypothetical protein sos41_14760 [Alphaproteobacteria bacterium SO-S41]|nr:hypothetical protein sos41_14760 [Alphaproteobacteria bacterium SO-S41]
MNEEVKAFQEMWEGGYWEGDPTDPHFRSTYAVLDAQNGYADQSAIRRANNIAAEELGFLSTLYVTYLLCIRDRVKGRTVLEIGPGRGSWSKAILDAGAAELYALDALSAKHNQFFEYVDPTEKYRDRIKYFQVEDFSCTIPDGKKFDFFFSFGCFCHIRRPGTREYFQNIYQRMTFGAEGFVMISDYGVMAKALGTPFDPDNIVEGGAESGVPWSHLGTEWFRDMLVQTGFTVLNPDVGCNLRDPVVHFRK